MTLLASHPTRYFKNEKYLKFKNRPVVYLYVSRAIDVSPGTDPAVAREFIQSTFNAVRDAARANLFDDLHIVADQLYVRNDLYKLKDELDVMGARAVTAFGLAGDKGTVLEDAQAMTNWTNRLAELYEGAHRAQPALGMVDISPSIFPQYDDTGLRDPSRNLPDTEMCTRLDARTTQRYHLQNGGQWQDMIRRAGQANRFVVEQTTVDRDCNKAVTTNSDYTWIVWVYSFNEWGEGSGIEPLENRSPRYPFGFGYEPLQLLKSEMESGPPAGLLSAPVLVTPQGSVETLRPLFAWEGPQYATEYEIVIRC